MPQPKEVPASLQQQNSKFRLEKENWGAGKHSRASLGADTALWDAGADPELILAVVTSSSKRRFCGWWDPSRSSSGLR